MNGVLSSLRPAGPVAAMTHEVTWVLIVGACVVFAIVMGALGWALWRRPVDPAPAAARWWILGGGIVFPLLVLLPLLVYATWRTHGLAPGAGSAAAGELVITVKGRLWWWEVTYRDPLTGAEVASANQIEIPVGRPVTLALVSDDVIHSFWVPPLAGKVDMVPGKVHHLRLQADRPGVYRGQCAEFCGEQHARMALAVVARTDFDSWLAVQARPAASPADALAVRGMAVFHERRCQTCHDVRGLAGGARFGPDLTHLGSRGHLAAGTLPMSREALARWIADPQQVKPSARMPSYALPPESMTALVAFLEQLH